MIAAPPKLPGWYVVETRLGPVECVYLRRGAGDGLFAWNMRAGEWCLVESLPDVVKWEPLPKLRAEVAEARSAIFGNAQATAILLEFAKSPEEWTGYQADALVELAGDVRDTIVGLRAQLAALESLVAPTTEGT